MPQWRQLLVGPQSDLPLAVLPASLCARVRQCATFRLMPVPAFDMPCDAMLTPPPACTQATSMQDDEPLGRPSASGLAAASWAAAHTRIGEDRGGSSWPHSGVRVHERVRACVFLDVRARECVPRCACVRQCACVSACACECVRAYVCQCVRVSACGMHTAARKARTAYPAYPAACTVSAKPRASV